MAFNGFSAIGSTFETAASVINSASAAISQVILPVVILVLTIWVTNYGIAVYRGEVHQPVMNFIGKNYKMLFFLVFGLSAGVFQKMIVPSVMEFNTGLMNAVAGSATGTIAGIKCSGSGPYGAMDCFVDQIFTLVGFFFEAAVKEGGLTNLIDGILYILSGLLIFFGAALFGVFMMFELIEARLMLFMALGLGPLFIVAGAFPKTENFFNNWVAKLVNLAILNALLVIYVGMALKIFMGSFADFTAYVAVNNASAATGNLSAIDVVPGLTESTTTQANSYASHGNVFLVSMQIVLQLVVLAFLAMKIPNLASGLTGGGYGGSGAAAFVGGMMTQSLARSITKSLGTAAAAPGRAAGAAYRGAKGLMGGGNQIAEGTGSSAAQRARDRASRRDN